MRKVFKILLSSCALISLLACVDTKNDSSSSENEITSSSSSDSSEGSNSSENSIPQEVYYHVIFLNYDETKLYETDVLEGAEAVYGGATPAKPEDDEFTYEFDSWDKDLTNIQADVTTMAVYSYTPKENWGGLIWF